MSPEPNIYCIQTITGIQYGYFDIYKEKSGKVILKIGDSAIVLRPDEVKELKIDPKRLQTK